MCSKSPTKNLEDVEKPTSCCPGTFSRTRRFLGKKMDQFQKFGKEPSADVEDGSIEGVNLVAVIGKKQNIENLPPDHGLKGGKVLKKKYTVNKKRSAKDSYDRLRQHVPAIKGKDDVSQLDVLLEAIEYIQSLRKDLGKDDTQPSQDINEQHQLDLERALAALKNQHTTV